MYLNQPGGVTISNCVALALGVSLSISCHLPVHAESAALRPNIVFIMADDLGIGDLGYTNQIARAAANLPAISTPNIDKLASDGVNFTRMYSGAPICSPSRASLLTGFEINHVIKEHTDKFNGFRSGQDDDKTWGQMLQDAGYKTGMWGKWHLGGVNSSGAPNDQGIFDFTQIPTQQGFETAFGSMHGGYRVSRLWENDGNGGLKYTPVAPDPSWPGPGPSYRYSQDVTSDHAVNYIRNHANGADPFAMYVAFEAVHDPLDRLGPGEYEPNNWPDVQERYANMVTGLDRNVGDLIAAIEDPNGDGDKSDSIAANTLVIFTSDNGALWTPHVSGFNTEFFDSNGSYRGQKSNTLEGGIITPFLVRWDGVTTPGAVNSTHVGSFADIFPTFAELAGQDTPFGLDGRSMLPAILGQPDPPRTDAIVWTDKDNFAGLNQASYAIQMGGWKFIHRVLTNTEELYHIEVDPYETTNISSSRIDMVTAFKAVAQKEGVLDEPYFAIGNTSQGQNVFFTQYKYWVPGAGANLFVDPANWSGGTQLNRDTDPDALFWNTGPASNWLAKVDNNLDGTRNTWVGQDATVLGLEVVGSAGGMHLTVNTGITLNAYNGVRIGDRGMVRLVNSTLKTVGDVEVRPGGKLSGSGTITGWQSLLAGIPEFAGQGLLEPTVINSGSVEIFGGYDATTPGLLSIEGDFRQLPSGTLQIDLFNSSGIAGMSYDFLNVQDSAMLAGILAPKLMNGFIPIAGQQFTVLSAGSLLDNGLNLGGPDGIWFSQSVANASDLILTFVNADFDNSNFIDGNDLAIWKANYGTSGPMGDANLDGLVDGQDFLAWQRQFGNSLALLATATAAVVPEPSTSLYCLSLFCSGVAFLRRRRRGC
ncbi:sulfatase-like hydrolase/transferase [Bythopirellula polymerisocia]|uniref:Arylsulfatase n=1 Tax=Bythopirellula polymerisocia TaxID=2528003 RepID=A0A5C6CT31_9BACT|nr:sulfatase-like hydrolase/transferase [Bythopirellula polymerisocia]TWU28103.1 Arylsulfatase [Bythopirellula polymerisocia]